MIMTKYKLTSPSDIYEVKIRKNNLYDVYEDDMAHFTNLSSIDL